MTLIKSISGVRGTIGGEVGKNFTPIDIVECASAYGHWISKHRTGKKIVIGRDARISGEIVDRLVSSTLIMQGFQIIELGHSTTPTVEMMVEKENADGGIIITASHNPGHWNALKFLNYKGEFISAADGQDILDIIASKSSKFSGVHDLGNLTTEHEHIQYHIQQILDLDMIDVDLIKSAKFQIVVDPVNSTGAIAIPLLLEKLGCTCHLINGEVSGRFAHNPEPLPIHLEELSRSVRREQADLGISVDPDVDRLALVCEDGSFMGEEYTLVAAADFVLSNDPGPTVSNVSSSMALRDLTQSYGQDYHSSAVGEVNVVQKMKEVGAVIGGEGNGGVIYPKLHYGRDALVGIVMILNLLAERKVSLSQLRSGYSHYHMVKDKIILSEETDINNSMASVQTKFSTHKIDRSDGLKVLWDDKWVQIRPSNTEPIMRIYAEAKEITIARDLVAQIKSCLTDV